MEEVKKLTQEEYVEQIQRLQADFENFRKRVEEQRKESASTANSNLIFQLLEVLDNLELSLKHNSDPGLKLVYSQFYKILEKQGLKQIKTDGKFNPLFHEAIIKEESDKSGIILEEIKKGYTLNDRLIRASKVRITVIKENKQ